MAFSYQPVVIDIGGDSEGTLAFRTDKLVAVLSRLGDMHEDLAGRWFVEAVFASPAPMMRETFATLDEFEDWFGHYGEASGGQGRPGSSRH